MNPHPSLHWIVGILASLATAPSGAPASAQDAAAPPDVGGLLRAMTLEEKVGQLFVVGANANFLNERAPEHRRLVHFVEDLKVGGVIWYRSKVYETAVLGARLQSLAKIPILFSCDLEAGMGMRFDDTPWSPWAMAVAATGEPAFARRLGEATAREARALGIAQVYAPVADVNVDPANPVINTRSFGEDPADVARFVVAFVEGCQRNGVAATVKHFPGHGDTAVDSHRSLPVLRVPRARLDAVELVPFRAAFEAGVRSVMVAHLAVPALDDAPAPLRADGGRGVYAEAGAEREAGGTLPATVSPKITTDLLRRELGFRGLVVTDAIDMGGIADHFEPGEAAVRAILAGADQLVKPNDPDVSVAAVLAAARSGRIPAERLDEAARRVLEEKARLALFDPSRRMPDLVAVGELVGSPEHEALYDEIARRSATLVRAKAGVLPLRKGTKLLHVVLSDDSGGTLAGAPASSAATLQAELERRVPGARAVRVDARTTVADAKNALQAAEGADAVVLSLLVRARSGSGKLEAPPASRAVVEGLLASGRPVVAVALGSPYVLRDFPALETALVTYGACDSSQRAAAGALFGEFEVAGALPVSIPGIAPRGSGLRLAPAK